MSIVDASVVLAQAPQTDFTNTLGGKIFLAVVGALLSLGGTLLVTRWSLQRSRRRLLWSVRIDSQALLIPQDVRDKVSISYGDQTISDLSSVLCTVLNDSKQGIRDHRLRFTVPEGAKILDFAVRPSPEPEQGYEEIPDQLRRNMERVAKVGYLGPGDSISFSIVTSGGDWSGWSPGSSNPTEDVEFERTDVARNVDDRSHVRPFFFWSVVLFFQSSFLGILPGFDFGLFGSPAGFIGAILFFAFLLPHILPVSRVVAVLVDARFERRRDTASIQTLGGNSIVLYNASSTAENGITIWPPKDSYSA